MNWNFTKALSATQTVIAQIKGTLPNDFFSQPRSQLMHALRFIFSPRQNRAAVFKIPEVT
jgi:hypothetical protein